MPEIRRIAGLAGLEVKINTELSDKLSAIPVRPKKPDQFREALGKLATDKGYREKATKDPMMIIQDFKLSQKELSALRNVARMSGADVRAVDRLTATAIAVAVDHAADTDIDVSCCSCCCCCCGETAATPTGW